GLRVAPMQAHDGEPRVRYLPHALRKVAHALWFVDDHMRDAELAFPGQRVFGTAIAEPGLIAELHRQQMARHALHAVLDMRTPGARSRHPGRELEVAGDELPRI